MKQTKPTSYGGLKNKHVFFVYDGGGLFLQLALQLGRDGHKVYYYTPFYDEELCFRRYVLGYGLKEIEKPLYFWRALMKYPKEEVTIMFPDVGNGDMASFLKKQGYAVFAAGEGDILENHRELLRQKMKEVGLPVNNYVQITGLNNLRNYLKQHNNKVVKLDIFRNDQESFKALTYSDAEPILDKLQLKFGQLADEFPFIVEDLIDGDEPGFDIIFNKTGYLTPYLWGFEVHKGPYCGILSDTLPEPLQLIADKLKPLLTKYDWRSFISTEAMVKDGKPYLIDICSRAPYPLGVGFTFLYENYSEIIYKVARGLPVTIKPRGKYMIVLPLEQGPDTDIPLWSNVKTPFIGLIKKDNNYYGVALSRIAKTNDDQYIGLPGYKNYINVVGVGNNPDVLAKEIMNIADKCTINGGSFNYDRESFNDAIKNLQNFAKKYLKQ
jgi:hypothetical protein